ncbi:glycosyltransferase [Planomicrobium sp. YIM 101495]|uniref:glycosyltransferase n=1 Tax=Planomicrobium sp. YIM 101495 TaxID=2665160 RepID=UPI0012BA0F24|nr:glycosyltransferase [Planomicrobium sp. YIM 101495]MTD30768.1 glycosyltransferase [Planomicrobium sp. YIM 101495]
MTINKIFIFTQDFPFGKIETFLESELLEISKYFSEITIVSMGQNKSLTRRIPEGINVVKLDRKYRYLTCFFFALASLFKQKNFNELRFIKRNKLVKKYSFKGVLTSLFRSLMITKRVELFLKNTVPKENQHLILYSYWMSDMATAIAKYKSSGFKGKVIARCHAFEVRDETLYIPFRSELEMYIDETYFISEYTQAEYNKMLEKLNISISSKQLISRLGIKVEEENFNKKHYEKLWLKSTKNFTLVSCSNVVSLKRLDLLILALSYLPENIIIQWVHFGDGELLDATKNFAFEMLNNKKNIKYEFKGHVQNKDVLKYYNENFVNLFINLSDIEGVPVSIMEAAINGIPSMARDVGGISEIIKNNENGILLKSNPTPKEIADSLIQFVKDNDNENKMAKMRESAFIHCKTYYNSEVNYENFFKKVLGN